MKGKCTVFTNICLLSLLVIVSNIFACYAENLTGAGATFPAPVYVKWADTYYKNTGKKINYQAIGSSGGIKQIIAHTVDFAASDIPISNQILTQEKLFQFPTIISGIVLAINLPGIQSGELIIDGKTLGDIYLGKIKKWNNNAIIKFNPKLALPAKDIIVIRRADSSGTSFVFTKYLTKVNREWKIKVGFNTTVQWPVGLGAKGNEGVAAFVQRIAGSIGYIEYAYVKKNNLTYTKLISADGQPVQPTKKNFSNSMQNISWEKLLDQDLINQTGKDVWPITATTFILIHTGKRDFSKDLEVLKFFDWAYKNGRKQANNLEYESLPENIIKQIRTVWKTTIQDCNK